MNDSARVKFKQFVYHERNINKNESTIRHVSAMLWVTRIAQREGTNRNAFGVLLYI